MDLIRPPTRPKRVLGAVLVVLLVAEIAPGGLAQAAGKQRSAKERRPAAETPAGPPTGDSGAGKSPAAVEARRRGTVALNIGHYEEAIKAFEEAYALDQDPLLLFHLAQSYRMAGQPSKALDACSAFLRSSGATGPDRAHAERFLAEVEMIVYAIRLQRDSGSAPTRASAPVAPPADLEPPRAASAETPATTNQRSALDLAPRSDATPSPVLLVSSVPVAPASKPFYRRTTFWALAGTAVVAGGVLVWLATRSNGLKAPSTQLGYQQAFP
ncbi:MAG TPA: tetratricopeptide repeat protein [Polyangia bacterium]